MSISASPGRLSCGSSLLAGGPLCIILGALCFSTTGTVQALAPDGSHPLGIGALRMQIGALALWAWCACRHSLPAGLRHWQLRWLIPATLGLLGFQVFFFWGVQQAGVAVGTVTAIGFSPVMAAILARIILGERPARIWYPATGLALAGLVLLNLGSSQDTSTAALLLPLLAGACYGAYFVFSKPLGRTHAPEHIMLLLCAGSGLLLLPVHFCTPPLWLLHPQGMGMALYLGVVTAALAFSLTLAGLRRPPRPWPPRWPWWSRWAPPAGASFCCMSLSAGRSWQVWDCFSAVWPCWPWARKRRTRPRRRNMPPPGP